MTTLRQCSKAVGCAMGLGALAAVLQLVGRGELAGPPLGRPDHWAQWMNQRDPSLAAFAILRVVAVATIWYLLAVTVLGVVLRLCGAVRTIEWADRITVAPLRRLLAGSVSLGLAASGLLVLGQPAARLPVAGAASQASAPPVTTQAPDEVPGIVTMHRIAPAGSVPPAQPAVVPDAAPPTGRPVQWWRVEPGQCFWSIADSILTTHLGRPPSDAEIVPYWRRLIDANRSELAHPGNADLVFPGQTFAVPAP